MLRLGLSQQGGRLQRALRQAVGDAADADGKMVCSQGFAFGLIANWKIALRAGQFSKLPYSQLGELLYESRFDGELVARFSIS